MYSINEHVNCLMKDYPLTTTCMDLVVINVRTSILYAGFSCSLNTIKFCTIIDQ